MSDQRRIEVFDGQVMPAAEAEAIRGRDTDRKAAEDVAQTIIAAARQRAAEIVAEAEARAAEQDERLAELSDAALQRFMNEQAVDEVAEALRRIVDESGRTRRDFDALLPWLKPMVAEAVTRIIGELPEDRVWSGIVRQAMGEVRERWDLVLRCHPSRADTLRRVLAADPVAAKAIRDVQPDRDLGPEDLFLGSKQGVLDIGVRTQVEMFLRALQIEIEEDRADHG